ncbi:MAG: hypothetical protein AAFR38_03070 [Planctomycetota bacterium]
MSKAASHGTATGGFGVGEPTGRCASTGGPIPEGEHFIAVLVEDQEKDRVHRVDFGEAAWESGARPGAAVRVLARWRSTMPGGTGPKKPLIDEAGVTGLFDQFAGATETTPLTLRYLLALTLIRKRGLELVGRRAAEGDEPAALLVRRRGEKEAEPEAVVIPSIDDAALVEAGERLGALLGLEGAIE